ncbi:hypothetical protein AMS68_000576 [Peltaster fructicola]|uniref:Uncharacterized protein n=1 Tax=Peltaster fructicola TaxID=286661 RepID=A0A6H0XKA1_9PEZI|nr:hypothetical protein AMS68_000576 [Peltaster fructicola]
MATTTAARTQVLAQYGFSKPSEEDILAALNLSREEFCRRHGFDPQSKTGLDKAARQLTLHMISGIQRELISRGVAAEDASRTAFEAVIDEAADSPLDDSNKGFARGLEHTTEDVQLFLAMNNANRPRLTQHGPLGNLQHGPGKNAIPDPFIGWPGLSLDLLAVQPSKPVDFGRTSADPTKSPPNCVDPKLLLRSPQAPPMSARSITTGSFGEHTAGWSTETEYAVQTSIKVESTQSNVPRALSAPVSSPSSAPICQRTDSSRDPLPQSGQLKRPAPPDIQNSGKKPCISQRPSNAQEDWL